MYELDQSVGGRPDSTSDRDVIYNWTGIWDSGDNSVPGTDNCGNWTMDAATIMGLTGYVDVRDELRFDDGGGVACNSFELADLASLGILCASY